MVAQVLLSVGIFHEKAGRTSKAVVCITRQDVNKENLNDFDVRETPTTLRTWKLTSIAPMIEHMVGYERPAVSAERSVALLYPLQQV